ncbi:MmcQ/YjbR family DNA-binding protein [Catelliglobosispora koreensis]|jgi:hypothetical protein|uniref:MmcQ/YjbR family DNA-binding protein n=1 Tax=Catelliglobosispora koreensis TaxID=129052 RepID=UPI000380ECE4|nr:MmcQ/YjbR family DNA-binding protein [Catelliglobosispora koreensis]
MAVSPVSRLRKLFMALPDVTEKVSHGEASWFYKGKKQIATMADHHHDDRVAMWCAAAPGVQQELIAEDPEKYFRPPYVGHRGWLGVYLDVPVDWKEIAEICADAHSQIAGPKGGTRSVP